MARLKILVAVLGLIIVGLTVLLVILLAAQANAPVMAPTPPASTPMEGSPSRTVVAVVAVLSGGGCLIVVGGILAWVYVWNRRTDARRAGAPPDATPPLPPPDMPPG